MNYEQLLNNLHQRLGQMAQRYEGEIAMLQAQVQELQNKLNEYESADDNVDYDTEGASE